MPSRRDSPGHSSRSAPDPLGPPPTGRGISHERIPWFYFLAFLAGTALVVVAMWYHIESERRSILAHWRARVSTIADDRARLVENWLNARRADAEVLAASPIVRALLGSQGDGGDALVRYLNQVTAAYGYASVWVFNGHGRLLARSSPGVEPRLESSEAAAVADTGRHHIDLIEEAPGRRMLLISVPVFADGGTARVDSGGAGRVLGVVTLRMKPEAGLVPLLADETVSTRTGETLLFRLDGDRTAYLSPFRQPPAGWDAIARSLDAIRGHVTATASAPDTFGELTDYRAMPAFAATRWIASTGWGLIFKVDREEALADFRRAGQLAGVTAAFLLLALAALLISLWRQQQRARLLRAQMEQERAIFNLKGYAEKIVASVPSGLLLLGGDLRVLSVNASFLEAFHLHQDDILGRELGDVVRAEGLITRAREVLKTGVAQRDILFDLHLKLRQENRPVLITMTGIRMAEEASARLLLIVQDLTEEERLQAARQASEQRFRDLVQGLDAIVWEADATTLRFSFASQRAEIILGWQVERWLREPDFFATRIHPDDRERAMQTCREAIARGTDHELEYRALTADGREVWLRDIVHVLSDAEGCAIQLRGVTVDLTERKRAEEALGQAEGQLRQAQKMDAVGKLAGGIAHDFNNLLMVIRGDSELILRRLPDGHPLRANAEGIREAADQAATLTRQLLAFSRKQVLAPAVLDLNQVVAGLHKMLERLIGETIDLVTVTAPDLGRVTADPGQLEQMLLNLCVNARDAMPDGGRLTIETGNAELDLAEAERRGVKAGAYVMLEVSDSGVGMDAEMQSHLFEPFFTTKDQGKGTGLGLSTVYGIVNQSGGHIRVDSQPGKGATFRVFLPRVLDTAAAPDAREAAPARAAAERETAVGDMPPPPRRETILLVEDAQRVRAVVREILDMHGYEVLEARDGAEALRISASHAGPIHLMVTDVVMPEMSGRELAQRLDPLRPDMKVLYMSGYTDDAIVRHGVLGSGMAFLAKPFTPDALAAKVREILDALRRHAAEATRRS
jgi:PAS domain S-box-containing protein